MLEILRPLFRQEFKEETPPGILRIGVDVDANVVNLYPVARRLIEENLGVDVDSETPAGFYLQERPEIKAISGGPEFVNQIFQNSFIYREAEPVLGAIEILNEWQRRGHQLWFVTARPKFLRRTTRNWFERNDLGWAKKRILFRSSFTSDRKIFKVQETKRLGLHIFIEDHAETMVLIQSGFMMAKIMMSYFWNEAEDAGSQILRVNSWWEIDRIVQAASCWHHFLNTR